MNNSQILLVCIGFNNDCNTLSSLTIDDLFLIFNPFGQIKKIIIFSQKILLKAFVEFEQEEDANNAIDTLHDHNLNNFGKVKVYNSPLKELSFNNKFLSFKNFDNINQNQYLQSLKQKLEVKEKSFGASKVSFVKKIAPNVLDKEALYGKSDGAEGYGGFKGDGDDVVVGDEEGGVSEHKYNLVRGYLFLNWYMFFYIFLFYLLFFFVGLIEKDFSRAKNKWWNSSLEYPDHDPFQ